MEDNLQDELNEDVVSESEDLQDASDLIRGKKNNTEMNNTGNHAEYQVFIGNAYLNGQSGFKRILESFGTNSSKKKVFNLTEVSDCIDFIENRDNNESLILAIIISAFEIVPISEIPTLMTLLQDSMPNLIQDVADGEVRETYYGSTYISINSLLQTINGKLFETDEDQKCVGLSSEDSLLLVVIWEQFPKLRQSITNWLILIVDQENTNKLNAYQLTMAFKQLISLDPSDAKSRIIPRLCENEKNIGLLGALAFTLYKMPIMEKFAIELAAEWLDKNYWKSYVVFVSYLNINDLPPEIKSGFKKIITINLIKGNKDSLLFFAMACSHSELINYLIIDVLNDLFCGDKHNRDMALKSYLNLLRYAYYFVSNENKDLPLVIFSTKNDLERISIILNEIMSKYDYRKRLYIILKAYIKELSNYNYDERTYKRLVAYFIAISMVTDSICKDVIFYLERCNNDLADNLIDEINKINKEAQNGIVL